MCHAGCRYFTLRFPLLLQVTYNFALQHCCNDPPLSSYFPEPSSGFIPTHHTDTAPGVTPTDAAIDNICGADAVLEAGAHAVSHQIRAHNVANQTGPNNLCGNSADADTSRRNADACYENDLRSHAQIAAQQMQQAQQTQQGQQTQQAQQSQQAQQAQHDQQAQQAQQVATSAWGSHDIHQQPVQPIITISASSNSQFLSHQLAAATHSEASMLHATTTSSFQLQPVMCLKELAQQTRQQAAAEQFPKRPGQTVCDFYARTGHCKFGQGCKFDHPQELAVPLSRLGLPRRLLEPVCPYYAKTGDCKYGPSCKFNHPEPP